MVALGQKSVIHQTLEEYENAYKEARKLINKLENNKDKLKEFTDYYLGKMM